MKGRITVVGLGPGDAGLLPPLAVAAIERAAAVVGYTGYVKLLGAAMLEGRRVIATGMRAEVERCAAAVDLALSGVETAMVCSGDPGVYAMSGLVLELLEARGLLDEVELEVVPGIPAVCAAAALLGAPLMHDFAVISLSDLLTPWPAIARRLEAALAADFVLALYNPRSRRRVGHLAEALAAARHHRAPETPVGMVKNAFRPGQAVRLTRLDEADPDWADMLTLVVIGASASRLAGGRMLTPRGYAGKYVLA